MIQLIKKNKNFLVLLVIVVIFVFDCAENFFSDYIFRLGHAVAAIFLVGNSILYFKNRKYFNYGIIIMLIFGLFNAAEFTLQGNIMTLSSNFFYIFFQPFSLLFIIIYVIINLKRLRAPSVPNTQEEKILSEEIIKKWEEDEILKLIEKFQSLNKDELDKKVLDHRYTPAAREAARRILNERN